VLRDSCPPLTDCGGRLRRKEDGVAGGFPAGEEGVKQGEKVSGREKVQGEKVSGTFFSERGE